MWKYKPASTAGQQRMRVETEATLVVSTAGICRSSLLGSLGRISKKMSCRRALSPARILSRQSCGGNRLFVWLRFRLTLRPSDFCLNGKNSQQLSLGEAGSLGGGGWGGEELHHPDKGPGGLLSSRGDKQEGGW